MIESSERGITLNKNLAWGILVTIAGGGFWVGVQVTELASGVATLGDRQVEDRADIAENARAIQALRSSNARIDQRLANIETSASRTAESVTEILRYLRGASGRPPSR
ncbi:hypothetical protein [Roseovarius sp.]